jgi:hypothetical protein
VASRERSQDHRYNLTNEKAAELNAKVGHRRTPRVIQKHSALSKRDCHKVETKTNERYLLGPYSVERCVTTNSTCIEPLPFATRLLRHRRKANTARPVANSGRVPGSGIGVSLLGGGRGIRSKLIFGVISQSSAS